LLRLRALQGPGLAGHGHVAAQAVAGHVGAQAAVADLQVEPAMLRPLGAYLVGVIAHCHLEAVAVALDCDRPDLVTDLVGVFGLHRQLHAED